MKFNDTSNTHNSLAHYVWYLLGGISSSEFPLADLSRATNTAKYNLAVKVWKQQDAWDFNDGGYTTFPIATTTLVDDQADYTLPTDAMGIRRVEVKDSAGNWFVVDPIDDTNIDVALDEFREVKGLPEYYRLENESIILYPAPSSAQVTTTAGIKLTYNREINEFDASTTTTDVGMGGLGDQVIAHEVAEEWAGIFRPDRLDPLRVRREELTNNFLAHISDRDRDRSNRLLVQFDNNE